ncbi:hypothetical protein BESB_025210 [Besnoitia besnoiti]|uniref:Uncharacterized protein n=1 Tax=Besnoitia besnoiti TaxID=94643 RepID=A0A2A9M0Q6_BESBE|nr:uncharacterized protein BESB_025210 [Besnoitia besnoiti]PFH31555.1 hypothetical protein BESB_025210 [Besnoitia besnoiti]
MSAAVRLVLFVFLETTWNQLLRSASTDGGPTRVISAACPFLFAAAFRHLSPLEPGADVPPGVAGEQAIVAAPVPDVAAPVPDVAAPVPDVAAPVPDIAAPAPDVAAQNRAAALSTETPSADAALRSRPSAQPLSAPSVDNGYAAAQRGKQNAGSRPSRLRAVGEYFVRQGRRAGNLMRRAGRWIRRRVFDPAARFLWRRRFDGMVNNIVSKMRMRWKSAVQHDAGCSVVASFVTRRRYAPWSPEEQPSDIMVALSTLFPHGASMQLKSRVDKRVLLATRSEFVGLSPYGSVLFKLESLSSEPETLLEAFPVVARPSATSATLSRETRRAMDMIVAATSGLSDYGIPLDLMMLKKAGGIWCHHSKLDTVLVPNVFVRRLLMKTLREVLTDMAAEASAETAGQGPVHEARLCLTRQLHQAMTAALGTTARRGRISIDTVFVSSNGAVHLHGPPLAAAAPLAAPSPPSEGAEGAAASAQSAADFPKEPEEDEWKAVAPSKKLTEDVAFAIVIAQIWCPSRSFEEVAEKVLLHHRLRRELTHEFYTRCAAVPEVVRLMIAEAVF